MYAIYQTPPAIYPIYLPTRSSCEVSDPAAQSHHPAARSCQLRPTPTAPCRLSLIPGHPRQCQWGGHYPGISLAPRDWDSEPAALK